MNKTLIKSFGQFLLKRMALISTFAAIAIVLLAPSSRATSELPWTAGIGLQSCVDLDALESRRVYDWVQGYWTGANLYLGGTDLCLERGIIAPISESDAIAALRVNCAPLGDSPIMFAAFNALKGLPMLEGSRAAGCEVEKTE